MAIDIDLFQSKLAATAQGVHFLDSLEAAKLSLAEFVLLGFDEAAALPLGADEMVDAIARRLAKLTQNAESCAMEIAHLWLRIPAEIYEPAT